MAGTAKVQKTLRASATQAAGTSYAPASTGLDMSVVRNQSSFAVWHTNAGQGTATVDLSFEYSNDGTNWFTPAVPTAGPDVFAQVTTAAVNQVRKPSIWANFLRVKIVVAAATSGAFSIVADWDGRGTGSYT